MVNDMKRGKILLVFLLTLVLSTIVSLVIIPLNAQATLDTTTTYRAPLDRYVLERNFYERNLSDSIEANIPFLIEIGKPADYNITTHFTWKVTMNTDAHDRVVSINYTFLSNDNCLSWIREDFVGALKGTFSGAYPPQTIERLEIMNPGDNVLKIKANLNAMSNRPSASYFKLEIYDVHINVTALDLDKDGIFDALDPLPTFHNFIGLSILSVCYVFPVFTIERHCHRKKH